MPALAVPFPIVNGHAYSYASVEIFWGPMPIAQKAFKSINYGAKLDPGEIRGTDPHVIGYTRGTHSSDGDAEAYLAQWELLKQTLGFAGVGYGEVLFTIIVQFYEAPQPGSPPSPVIRHVLENIRITEGRYSNQQGNEGSTVKLTMKMMDLDENGGFIAVPLVP
jgi:hypothetical protein